ncbi:helix-turn-helix domain-containing protein [Sphingopyxis indica]|uniref:helix-turn-helix transcriptional regulator n=1 Tax=Sphingopyxis indica TaxID=436663 RepID=UPI002938E86B|nr:AraC family transcriptional regulator [Sphingopyxis indica]WOF42999.1 helix-turn-helix domain-containing protein [Sphingopyxis indica]
MAHQQTPIWIVSGDFGRATVNITDRALVEHAHQQFNMIFMLGGADTFFKSGTETLALDDGSVLLFNPWVPHLKLANDGEPTMILSLIIETDWIDRVLEAQGLRAGLIFPQLREQMTENVRIQAERLAAAISRGMVDAADREEMILDLIDAVIRAYIAADVERTATTSRRPIDFRIRKALNYIHEHAFENPRIDEIARMVGLSRSHFFEQFRRCVGASPQHYIDHMRMKAATRRLSMGGETLVEIADQLGFAAHSNFTRFFAQHMAVSPSEFRRQTHQDDEASSG